MSDFFDQRLQRHQKQMLRYLRFVLNDHFVIALMFLLGGLGLYYSDLVKSLPRGFVWGGPLILFVLVIVLHFGSLVTLTKAADLIFLLPKEAEMADYLKKGRRYSLIFPFVLLLLTVGFVMPLYVVSRQGHFSDFIFLLGMMWSLKALHLLIQEGRLYVGEPEKQVYLGWLMASLVTIASGLFVHPLLGFLLGIVLLLLGYRLFKKRQVGMLDWQRMIQQEENRLHRMYQFINLFTDVPQITASVKRRQYLDGLLSKITFSQENTYLFLFARRILRGQEYSGLYLRLTILGSILLVFIQQVWFSLAVGSLFIYLIGFQLLPVYQQFQYMVLTHLYPVSPKTKGKALQKILLTLLLVTTGVFAISSWIALKNLQAALITGGGFLLVTLGFAFWYLPFRLKKWQD